MKQTIIITLMILLFSSIVLSATTTDVIIDNKALSDVFGTSDTKIIKDEIFTRLKVNDAVKKEAVFTMDASKLSSTDDLSIVFNEVCGKVKNYEILTPSTCYKDIVTYEYKDVEVCKLVLDNKTFEEKESCTINQEIINTIHTNTSYACEVAVKSLDGIKDYRVKANIQMEICDDGNWGYKVDWKPSIEIGINTLIDDKWAWWNASYDYKRFINCSLNNGMPIEINGSSGVTIDGVQQSIFTNCRNNMSLYYNSATDYVVVANDTITVPFEVVKGGGTSYQPTAVYNQNNIIGAFHLDSNATKSIDSAGISNITYRGYTGSSIPSYVNNATRFTNGTAGTNNLQTSIQGDTNKSLVCILNVTNTPSVADAGICMLGTYDNTGRAFLFATATTGNKIMFYGYNTWAIQVGTYAVGGIYLLTATYNATDNHLNIYINKTNVATSDSYASQLVQGNLTLNWMVNFAGDSSSDLALDEAMVFNKTLLGTDVTTLYNNLFNLTMNKGYGDIQIENCNVCSETCSPCGNGCEATDLTNMYKDVNNFDATYGDITGWNTSCITSMNSLFQNTSDFNQDISGWDVRNVWDMGDLFYYATAFNQPIGIWNTTSLNNTQGQGGMFQGATAFNQNLSHWNMSKVTDINSLFEEATSFNGDISLWDVSNVLSMRYLFLTSNFTGDISLWNTSQVTDMYGTFADCPFNNNISNWDVSQVTDMSWMFNANTVFNQDITNWSVGNVAGFEGTFNTATAFNQPIGIWNMSSATVMSEMFADATAFNQNLSTWNVGNLINADAMFDNIALSTANYNSLLFGWASQSLQMSVLFGGGLSTYYPSALSSRNDTLIGVYEWVITDGGLDCETNWSAVYGDCLTNDSMIKIYEDLNACLTSENLPEDNGTYIECNYCTQDLVNTLGVCGRDGTQSSEWDDENFFTCCFITGLESDCDILIPPYNTRSTVNCTPSTLFCEENLTTDFTCQYDAQPIIQNKINVNCLMPDNKTYCCVTNILQNGTLLATNPEYKQSTNALVSWKIGEEESRTCFTPVQQNLNAYYMSKNLRTDTPFTLEVLCSADDGTVLRSQYCITPIYDKPDFVVNRISWARANILYIIIGIALILILAFIIGRIKQRVMGH